ncbi:MAG: HAD family hydrolase [Burkholderiales bacterium]
MNTHPATTASRATCRAVLFDLDDTLVDHRHAAQAAMAGVRERFPAFASVPLADLTAEHHRILELLHREVALGVLDVAHARIERYRQLFAFVGADDRHAGAAAELHRRLYQSNRRPVPGALELVAHIARERPVAVVTNNTVVEQTEKLATFGFAPHVAALVTSEEVGAAKPDGRIFAAALARVGCAANEAVMVGDSWVHDVEGAQAAGIAAVWLARDGGERVDAGVTVLTGLVPADAVAARILAAR